MTENRKLCDTQARTHHMKIVVTLEEGRHDRTQAGIQIPLIQVCDAPGQASGAKGKSAALTIGASPQPSGNICSPPPSSPVFSAQLQQLLNAHVNYKSMI